MNASRLGTDRGTYRGSATKKAKLSERVIPVVRELYGVGVSTRQLARGLGVHHTAIWQAVNTYAIARPDGTVTRRYYTWNHAR